MTKRRPPTRLTPEQKEIVASALGWMRRLANTIAGWYGLDADELAAIGEEVLTMGVPRFDPKRGAFESFMYARVYGEMVERGTKQRRSASFTLIKKMREAGYFVCSTIDEAGSPWNDTPDRALGRVRDASDALMAAQFAAFGGVDSTPADEQYEEHELRALVRREVRSALEQFDVRDRALLEGTLFGGKTATDTARELQMRDRTARDAYQKALKRLSSLLRQSLAKSTRA